MAEKEKIAFIINPIAGTKSKRVMEEVIKSYLDDHKFTPGIAYTERAGHGPRLAREFAEQGYAYVIAVGGDGTVNEVATALMETDAALGIIPFGSGNGLARHLKIPLRPKGAIEVINSRNQVTIDVGLANGRAFFCTAGIGFDAHVGQIFSRSKKRGFNTYVRTVLQEFLRYRPLHYVITADGKTLEKEAFSISFANAGQFGNDAYISPEADIRDGKLDLCIIRDYPRHVGIHLGLRLFNKTMHKSRFVEIRKMTQAKVICPDASCFHLDGEHLPLDGPLEVRIKPSGLKILVP